jgi:hypothetical protein
LTADVVAEPLIRFLIDVSEDPVRLAAYRSDPEGQMQAAGLSEEERAALRTADSARVRDAMRDSTADLLRFVADLLVEADPT